MKSTWPQNPENGPYSQTAGAAGTCAYCHYAGYAGRFPDVTGAVGGNPDRDHLYKYCDRILTAEISDGTGNHASGANQVGPMYPNVKFHTFFVGRPHPHKVTTSNIDALYTACKTAYAAENAAPSPPKFSPPNPPVTFTPANSAAWVKW